jgi:two-component sensor histidine kinase
VQEGLRFQETRDRDIYVHLTEQSRRLMFLLESRAGSTKGKAESWDDTIAHVKDLFQVHDSVYSSGSIRSYPVARQLQTLAARLFKRLGQARVTYTVDADPLEMDVRLASGLLLIMQELVSNSLQHAFPAARKGHVKIFLKETEGKGILLQVSDDGIGLRKDVDVRKVRSGGLEFVRKLAAGMKGSVDVEREKGTSFRIEIPT